MERVVIFSMISMLMMTFVVADPSVSSISGTIEHGQTITISGSGFGSKNPAAPLWWDDMEGAQDGVVVNDYSDLPWVTSSMSQKKYSEAKPFRGIVPEAYMTYRAAGYRQTEATHAYSSMYATASHWQHEGNNPQYSNDFYQNVVLTVDSGTADKNQWYVHWYYRVDPAWTVINNWANHKMGAPNFGTTIYDSPNCYSSHGQESTPGKSDAHDVIIGVANGGGGCAEQVEVPGPNPRLKWVAHEQLWDSPAAFHEMWKYAGPGSNSGKTCYFEGDISSCRNAKDNTRSFSVGGWFCTNTNQVEEDKRGHQNNFRYFDDIYMDNTFSRVVLADNSNFEQATIVEPQIPSAWSGNSITVNTNLGALTGNTAYIFVFDADNNYNAVGYSITLDSGPAPYCGDGSCNGADTCENCEQDCSECPVECAHDADIPPCDGIVSLTELIDYINRWKTGEVTLQQVVGAIVAWKE